MSENEDETSCDFADDYSQQSYQYESCTDEEDESSANKRQRENESSSDVYGRRKYLDAGDIDLRIWSQNNLVRMSIAASIRQIADHNSGKLSVLFSADTLLSDDVMKTFRIFVDVCPSMTVAYDLTFNATVEIKESPPVLRCVT
jgi:hypothetical protein